MHLTKGQTEVLRRTLAFTDRVPNLTTGPKEELWNSFQPSEEAIERFFAHIDRGETLGQSAEATQLFTAWKLWQPERRSGGRCLQEKMWLEGHFEGIVSLASLAMEYVKDGIGKPDEWHYRLPAYTMLCRLRAELAN